MPELAPETLVDGRYRVLDRLGSGGMADVFCAEDVQLGRRVALKLLHSRFAADEEFVERFRREAQSAAGLQHPNVVGVYDRGQWDGTNYIAMEYLPGRTLKQVIAEDAPMDPRRAIEFTSQILKAARFAHKRGVIHRDLKPHNVIVDDEDRAKVTDFGIARAGASDMTETGAILGTAEYLSPEQAQGRAVSEQSDLYAVGVILYELLTGRLPFEGDSAVAIAVKHVSEDPRPPSSVNAAVPPALDRVVLWALEKDPARRPADAQAFLAALEEVGRELPPVDAGTHATVLASGAPPAEASAAPVPEPAPEPEPAGAGAEEEKGGGRRRRWLLAALVVALLAGGGVAAYLLSRPEKVPVPEVVGQSFAVARTRLQTQGFVVTALRQTSAKPADEVIAQNPLAGEEVEKSSTVSLTVSAGPAQAAVPAVAGQTLATARERLKKAGFRVDTQEAPSANVAQGRVVSVSPAPGTKLDRGSPVTVTVSTGPALVTIPGVVGSDRARARGELEGAGFTVTETQQESTQAPGTVLAQSPRAGTAAVRGSTVSITVAKRTVATESRLAVPGVTGQDSGSATNALSAAGFTPRVRTREVASAAQDGKVLAQDPPAGTKARKGSVVTIVVGKFKPAVNPGGQPPGGGDSGTTPNPGTNPTP